MGNFVSTCLKYDQDGSNYHLKKLYFSNDFDDSVDTSELYIVIFINKYKYTNYENNIDYVISKLIKLYNIKTFYELINVEYLFSKNSIHNNKTIKMYRKKIYNRQQTDICYKQIYQIKLYDITQKDVIKYILKYFVNNTIDGELKKINILVENSNDIELKFDQHIKTIGDLYFYTSRYNILL